MANSSDIPRRPNGMFASKYDQVARRIMMKALGEVTAWEADSWNIGVDAQLDALRVAGFTIVRAVDETTERNRHNA